MSEMKKLIRDTRVIFLKHGFNSPISIEVDEFFAEALKPETLLIRKYAGKPIGLAKNEVMLYGIKLIAPNNFDWSKN